MKKIDSYWVSIAAIVIGAFMIWGTVVAPARGGDLATFKGLVFAANIIAASIIMASGILSLAIRQVFDKSKDNNEKK